jgi:hypothetical protein
MAKVALPTPRVAFAQGMLIKNKGAAAAFCGLVALVALAMIYSYLSPINNYQYYRPTSNAANESIQDTSAETIAYYTKVLAWFTGLLATISIGQGYFLYRADKLGRDNLTKVQRSFVFIRSFETKVINNKVSVTPLWENSGSTPAEDQTMWANWRPFAGLPDKDFYLFDHLQEKWVPHGTTGPEIGFIGPHAIKYGHTLVIPIEYLMAVSMGSCRVFVWGWAQYKDVFLKTEIHRTEFCNEIAVTDMTTDPLGNKQVSVRFDIYGSYNTAK